MGPKHDQSLSLGGGGTLFLSDRSATGARRSSGWRHGGAQARALGARTVTRPCYKVIVVTMMSGGFLEWQKVWSSWKINVTLHIQRVKYRHCHARFHHFQLQPREANFQQVQNRDCWDMSSAQQCISGEELLEEGYLKRVKTQVKTSKDSIQRATIRREQSHGTCPLWVLS